ncbi:hypothetical protein E1B28_005041 [Marasmius oreades]|uniref:Uncharacterized protein n=1 Tax=Marasmius oreades TaxID=181124 RepID=A0A9P7UZW4_9AGAR|nr:uncharacterized protein E1B28_005041 [Marasmius oreades]KAG7097718.1 hypothetical protein E1B28_005041 [Marasmius oreades]
MSFFQDACGVSIGQGTFNAVTGNQINHFYKEMAQQKKEHTIYDEFYRIKLGAVHRIRDIHCENYPRQWDVGIREQWEERRFRVDRTICAAKIRGEQASGFTVVSYSGPEKDEAWKEDFQRFSKATNTTKMQLFGINRSSVPLLIFHGELLPLDHFWHSLGWFGRGYARTLASRIWKCNDSEMWIDPEQGTIIRGMEGPDRSRFQLSFAAVETLASSAELLLDEDVCFRYLSRRFPLVKEFDRDIIDMLHYTSEIVEEKSPILNQPYILSSKGDSIIAVGNSSWIGGGCIADRVIMPDGRTRFTLTDKPSVLVLCSDTFGAHAECAWLSQASGIFNRLGISLNDHPSSHKLILPSIWLGGSIKDSLQRSEGPPIYFFLHSLPVEDGSVVPTHNWSYDEDGETPIPHHLCKYLGLPTELGQTQTRLEYPPSKTYRWPSKMYETIHKWQTARGFDPTTTDFAQYLGYSIYEVQLARFEELGAGPSESVECCGKSMQ